jgi:tRNA G26 N,N-dimethylase Trm1
MNGYRSIKEGVSTILIPLSGEVFYNPVQEFNRDLSILVVSKFEQSLRHSSKVYNIIYFDSSTFIGAETASLT